MKKVRDQVRAATVRFAEELGVHWSRAEHDQVWKILEAAFLLYALEWGTQFDVRNWNWPYEELRNGTFDGSNPWAILLREAVRLVRENKKGE